MEKRKKNSAMEGLKVIRGWVEIDSEDPAVAGLSLHSCGHIHHQLVWHAPAIPKGVKIPLMCCV